MPASGARTARGVRESRIRGGCHPMKARREPRCASRQQRGGTANEGASDGGFRPVKTLLDSGSRRAAYLVSPWPLQRSAGALAGSDARDLGRRARRAHAGARAGAKPGTGPEPRTRSQHGRRRCPLACHAHGAVGGIRCARRGSVGRPPFYYVALAGTTPFTDRSFMGDESGADRSPPAEPLRNTRLTLSVFGGLSVALNGDARVN